jgi:hypothetical protein
MFWSLVPAEQRIRRETTGGGRCLVYHRSAGDTARVIHVVQRVADMNVTLAVKRIRDRSSVLNVAAVTAVTGRDRNP